MTLQTVLAPRNNITCRRAALTCCTRYTGHTPDPWREFDHSPYKPPPLEISEAIGLLESYFDSKRLNDALPALQQLRSLIAVGDGKPLVDRSLVIQEHMKWLEDPAHDLWLVPDGSSTQYFDLRTNDEKFTGYVVLTLKKEAQTGMRASYCLYFPVVLLLKAFHRICRFSDSHRQFGREFTNLLATFHLNHRTAHLPIMSLIVWFRACAQKLRLTSRTTTTPTEYCAKKHGKMPKNPACHAKAAILSRMAALFPLTKFQSICYHSSPRNFLKQ